jgi:hypothetical protein
VHDLTADDLEAIAILAREQIGESCGHHLPKW